MATEDRSTQIVTPKDGDVYSEIAYSHIYGSIVSIGANETRLIWGRYAGFLVLQGFIITASSQILLSTKSGFLILASILGLICSVSWHILNFAGWLNQNIWYSMAAQFHFVGINVHLPTDWWKKRRALRPRGAIYSIAQGVPLMFIVLYSIATSVLLSDLGVLMEVAISSSIVLIALSLTIITVVENKEYRDRKEYEDECPIS
jgi:hypothetical protein